MYLFLLKKYEITNYPGKVYNFKLIYIRLKSMAEVFIFNFIPTNLFVCGIYYYIN